MSTATNAVCLITFLTASQPRSQSSSAISDVTSPVKLVGPTRSQAQIQDNTEMSYDHKFANIMNMQSDRRSKTGFP